jgi:hypothetical protein
MAEVLVDFDIQLQGPDGRMYGARACGREREDRLWEGWIEFDPTGGGDAVRTGRETTQPNRADLFYWATGLTASYLDGALLRTLRQFPPLRPRHNPRAQPSFDGPAEHEQPLAGAGYATTALLDPFRVYAAGPEMLRGQLHALSRDQLGNIVKAYHMSRETPAAVDAMAHDRLVALIMEAVERARK